MPYEMLVGLEVTSDGIYTNYREAMKPILFSYGGRFGYDFKVSEVLLCEVTEEINRVFTISFPSEIVMEKFFNDPDYLKVKNEFFTQSVRSTTIIAGYQKD